jgi:DNA-binding transcriptional ArsR family regulator
MVEAADAPVDANVKLDYDALGELLRVLSYPARLRLLSQMRRPRTISELLVTPGRPRAGDRPERPISRQAVLQHLEQMKDSGLVRARLSQAEDARGKHEYAADPTRLFALLDDLRQVLQANYAGPSPAAQGGAGARLILVYGAYPGRVFSLRDRENTRRGWVIGRKVGAHVQLEYDPYVSGENAEILPRGSGYELLDLRTARNGTQLNWTQLPVGASAPLRTGDVVGVGRSLLVFRED